MPSPTHPTSFPQSTADVFGPGATDVAVPGAVGFAVCLAKPTLGIITTLPACVVDGDAQELSPSPSSSVLSTRLPSPLDVTLDLPAVAVFVPVWSLPSIDVEVDRLAERLAAWLLVSEDVEMEDVDVVAAEVPQGDVEENHAHTLEVPAGDDEMEVEEDVVEVLTRMMAALTLDDDVEMVEASEVDVEMAEEDLVEDAVEVLTRMMASLTLGEDVEMAEASEVDVEMVEVVDEQLSEWMGALKMDEEDTEMVAVEDVMDVDAAGSVRFCLASRIAYATNNYFLL